MNGLEKYKYDMTKGAFEVHGQEFKRKLISMIVMFYFSLHLAACAGMEEVEELGLTVHNTRDEP